MKGLLEINKEDFIILLTPFLELIQIFYSKGIAILYSMKIKHYSFYFIVVNGGNVYLSGKLYSSCY